MEVAVNGCPKMGNHALLKACELLGAFGSVNHIPFGRPLPPPPILTLFVYRDPRNALISWIRQKPQVDTSGTFISEVRRGEYMRMLREFVPYMKDEQLFKVRYESLCTNATPMLEIAEFLGVAYQPAAHERLPGLTPTWNERRSDFRQLWTPLVAAVWRDAGGDALVEAFGYQVYES